MVTHHHALRLVGQSVYAHHVTGRVYHGHLHSATTSGIYLMTYQRHATVVSADQRDRQIVLCQPHESGTEEMEPVFLPALFLTYGALLGLAAARPYYYGYPYYW